MIDKETARRLAEDHVSDGYHIDDAGIRELREGWFFPYREMRLPAEMAVPLEIERVISGRNPGVIINKRTGAALRVGGWCLPVERELELYDEGYQFDVYDLVVTSVNDLEGAIAALIEIGVSVTEPTYEHGNVWRIARPLTSDELKNRLAKLPCVFGQVVLYRRVETLERARADGVMECEVLKAPSYDPPGS